VKIAPRGFHFLDRRAVAQSTGKPGSKRGIATRPRGVHLERQDRHVGTVRAVSNALHASGQIGAPCGVQPRPFVVEADPVTVHCGLLRFEFGARITRPFGGERHEAGFHFAQPLEPHGRSLFVAQPLEQLDFAAEPLDLLATGFAHGVGLPQHEGSRGALRDRCRIQMGQVGSLRLYGALDHFNRGTSGGSGARRDPRRKARLRAGLCSWHLRRPNNPN